LPSKIQKEHAKKTVFQKSLASQMEKKNSWEACSYKKLDYRQKEQKK